MMKNLSLKGTSQSNAEGFFSQTKEFFKTHWECNLSFSAESKTPQISFVYSMLSLKLFLLFQNIQ